MEKKNLFAQHEEEGRSRSILNRRLFNFWTNQIISFSQIWPLQQLKAEDLCM